MEEEKCPKCSAPLADITETPPVGRLRVVPKASGIPKLTRPMVVTCQMA